MVALLADACGEDLERFLAALALEAQVDMWDPRADRISVLTLHAAKGLEFGAQTVLSRPCADDGTLILPR